MALTAELGEDLAALVGAVGVPLAAVRPLSRRGTPAVATAFRLRFADGSLLKGSRFESPAAAGRVAALASDLGPIVPRIVARGGAALLSEWVGGQTLAGVEWSESLLRRCGAAHARVHARAVDAEDPVVVAVRWRRTAADWLAALGALGVLGEGEAAALGELIERHAPARCDLGISLGDYCADNVVCRADGEPCLIDIETVAIAPSGYDLGRTWYRWPMRPAQRAAYLAGYGAHRDAEAFLGHLPFWHAVALVEGARYRHRQQRADVVVPLDGLRALLRAGARRS